MGYIAIQVFCLDHTLLNLWTSTTVCSNGPSFVTQYIYTNIVSHLTPLAFHYDWAIIDPLLYKMVPADWYFTHFAFLYRNSGSLWPDLSICSPFMGTTCLIGIHFISHTCDCLQLINKIVRVYYYLQSPPCFILQILQCSVLYWG